MRESRNGVVLLREIPRKVMFKIYCWKDQIQS